MAAICAGAAAGEAERFIALSAALNSSVSTHKSCICLTKPRRENATEREYEFSRKIRVGFPEFPELIRGHRRDFATVHGPGSGRTRTTIEKSNLSQDRTSFHQRHPPQADAVARTQDNFQLATKHKKDRPVWFAVAYQSVAGRYATIGRESEQLLPVRVTPVV
jgi:hypothetical protein